MKLFRINQVICNSYFTKGFIDKEYGLKSMVIYPPIDVQKIRPKRKENIILAVGRFSQLTQAKRQDVLVEAFKKLVKNGLNDWQLILAGGVEVGAKDFLIKLEKKIRGYPIQILKSPVYKDLIELYGKAKIFWSASGFDIDEIKEPSKVEHFGISVVEAMAGGAVPLVVNAGGHKEIIDEGSTGFLWSKKGELVKKTKMLVENNELLHQISTKAIAASNVYEYERFAEEVEEII
jgi:glycosyltransferase involved in cell wall biosynthesis